MSQQTAPEEMSVAPIRWRRFMWLTAGALLLLPAVAMIFTNEVAWGPGDFVLLAVLLGAVCGAIDLASRNSASRAYLAGVGVAVIGMFLMIFANLAVGIVGNEDNPLNLAFWLIPAIGIAGSVFARFEARGMAHALEIMAALQFLLLVFLWQSAETMVLLAMVLFVTIWLLAAQLLRAAR